MKFILYLILLCLPINGCFVDTDPVRVVSVFPEIDFIVKADVEVEVKFSKPMSKVDTEKSFLLTRENETVKGDFRWKNNDKEFIFTPEKLLLNNKYYTVRIGKSSKDKNLNSIINVYLSKFHVGSDFVHPVVVSTIPENLSDNFNLKSDIIITFSEPMDRINVERNISVSPSLEFYFKWDSPEIVRLISNYGLTFNTDYIISGFEKCNDISGNNIHGTNNIYFRSGVEFKRPIIGEIIPSPLSLSDENGNFNWMIGESIWKDVDEETRLDFIFDEPIDRQSLENNILFEPGVSFYIIWDSDISCKLIFQDKLSSGIEYKLNIKKGLSDIYGNKIEEEKIIYFKTDKYLTPEILLVLLTKISGDEISTLEKDSIAKAGTESADNNYYKIKISFNVNMDRLSIHDNIFIRRVYGDQPEMSGAIKEYDWIDERNLILTISSIEGDNLYELNFLSGKNGIISLDGLWIESDVKYYFIFDSTN